MSTPADRDHGVGTITVRYWAGARAAAGVPDDSFEASGGLTLAALVEQVLDRHPGDRMARTVAACSVLLGDQPVGSRDPAAVVVPPGAVVELLPPFAGG
ncbi:Molybdopterin converting factor, small subunit [Nocardioides exalbidus]|uniref:Molybdopterin converting factor, small subunit n=1 Tax=Nocardioides exalbidus TaxID=402596 RepID=A0A1H4LI95_9ACTN|nr:MoaD/ThiS family protein [Nocardioides exalbidus]SEB70450.1 Molybdopterin converting factor, small subunit [Nocardioides exalbidus]